MDFAVDGDEPSPTEPSRLAGVAGDNTGTV
jgi:hypothetical protein